MFFRGNEAFALEAGAALHTEGAENGSEDSDDEIRGWSRRERQACRHSHYSPEGFYGRPPLRSLSRLSRCRDPRPSRPPLGSQELSLLRCQEVAEENRLPSLEQIVILRKDSLIIILISGLVVRTDMGTFDNLFHFLKHLASFTHDGVEVFLKLFYEW